MKVSVPLCALPLALMLASGYGQSSPSGATETGALDSIPSVEMTAPPVPTSVTAGKAAKPAPKPVGPHTKQDPHAELGPERLIKVALQHESEGRLELALKTLADGMYKYPSAAQLYAVRASLRLQMQQVSAALGDLETAVRLAPADPKIRVNRAQAYRSFGRYDEAMADLDMAISKAPDLVPARFNRGALLYAQTEFDKALADFNHCVAIDPHAPAPYFNRASTYWELGRSDEAMADLEHFVELTDNPDWKKSAEDLIKNWQNALASEAKAAKSNS